ncbi:MAG: aconitate hydratase AcnA [Labilithrix sp.]|nr:aconitate hydratase AcnA [Labilithrix sp.]MCW5811322.1 aconitate hydratase AcnA [Labilithrix sp.]
MQPYSPAAMSKNSFGSQAILKVGAEQYSIYRLDAVYKKHPAAAKLPFSMKILLENLLRTEDGASVTEGHIEAVANWKATAEPTQEIAFTPSRVLLQDFTGVPCVVDLAAMRDAMKRLGGDPRKINPLQPVELVIDHSVQVDDFGSADSFRKNAELEFERNQERYRFLKWGQHAFVNFKAVPPDTGIVHQVNLEFLARVVMASPAQLGAMPLAYPDTVVGTDSHTTMINGVGVLGWGVGGIEAEAAMLGQPVSMLLPHCIGVRLKGKLNEGTTATDLVLTITQMLRKYGVVGKFVEFFGPGLADLPLADRATIANMAPEYGATCGIFPIDAETIRYLKFSGRSEHQVALVESYAKEQGLWQDASTAEATYTHVLELDLATVEPSLAGPARPQDRVNLSGVKASMTAAVEKYRANPPPKKKSLLAAGDDVAADKNVKDSSVVIAAITSCTNTSNPSVLMAAGLLAKKAAAKGLKSKPWVKPSIGPGSKVVTEYLKDAGLLPELEKVGFYVVGYGCTTCIGNSGPLPAPISKAIDEGDLFVASVLSGNRNFEGRVHAEVRANYLASPPLVVAYALAGRADIDLTTEPLGEGKGGEPVFLKDIWPTQREVSDVVEKHVTEKMFREVYADVYAGDKEWQSLVVPEGDLYQWENDSTYVKNPPYFDGMSSKPGEVQPIAGARVLAVLGDSITTDHISPAGSIKADGPAGKYLIEHGVKKSDFNSYGSRRGNHEVMVRGTFANVRLRNQLAPGTEGGVTRHLPSGEQMSIFDASVKYIADGVPLFVIAGKEYGSGSSRDWAAKGPKLLGVRAVLAESYERIHRSNLVGMGILPLQFTLGENASSLGLTGEEVYDVVGLPDLLETGMKSGRTITVKATAKDGTVKEIKATVRIDTPQEILYYKHGGILPYVLRQLLAQT